MPSDMLKVIITFLKLLLAHIVFILSSTCHTDCAVRVLFSNMAAEKGFVIAAFAIEGDSNMSLDTRSCLMTDCFLV